MFNEQNFNKKIYEYVDNKSKIIESESRYLNEIEEFNTYKVINAFQKVHLSSTDFSWTTGYGYNDVGREKVEEIFCEIFKAKSSLVRQEITCGTHAISLALFGILQRGDELLYISGKPYDTLQKVIGLVGSEYGNLISNGVKYNDINLINNEFDVDRIIDSITDSTKVIAIQRSPGYSSRKCISINQIEKIISIIKSKFPSIIIMIDNCYCEFVDKKEPIEVGADIVVGSLLKNLGSGIVLNGGYIVSNSEKYIEMISNKLTCPGLGKHVGVSFGTTRSIVQGLYYAPHAVVEALKSASLFSICFDELNYKVIPKYNEKRSDIIQVINLKEKEKVIDFCKSIQESCCVDSYVTPIPSNMAGYSDEIIMASGSFIDGSSIELSSDGPLREPYNVYYQGCLSFYQSKIAITNVLVRFFNNGYIDKEYFNEKR